MRNICTVIGAILFLSLGQIWAAQVTNVSLQYQDGYAKARVEVDGKVRFTHQTEAAKDGKPFRVIIDVLSATHHLPAKEFTTLPACPVRQIRTSQYAVQPEKVVRIVFDMEGESVYRVSSNDNSIMVFFPDKQRRSFARWSAADLSASSPANQQTTRSAAETSRPATSGEKTDKAGKSIAEINKAIDQDHLASLTGESVQPSKTVKADKKGTTRPKIQQPAASKSTKKTSAPPVQPTVAKGPKFVPNVPYGPEFDPAMLEPPVSGKSVEGKRSSPTTTAELADAAEKRSTQEQTAMLSKAGSSQPSLADKAKKQIVKEKKQPPQLASASTADENKSVAVNAEAKSEKAKNQQKESETEEEDDGGDSTATLKKQQPKDKERSTARFRRSPTRPTKIKGTLVAEFPKRLVIKYKSGGHRDPFETLINDVKTYDNPIEKRIPNVEGLELVGVLESDAGANSALFEDKEGYGYILKEGDKVQKGYVLRIEPDRVYFQIFEYGWSRTVALNMDQD